MSNRYINTMLSEWILCFTKMYTYIQNILLYSLKVVIYISLANIFLILMFHLYMRLFDQMDL